MMVDATPDASLMVSRQEGWLGPFSASALFHLAMLGPVVWWVGTPPPQLPATAPILVELVSLVPPAAEPPVATAQPALATPAVTAPPAPDFDKAPSSLETRTPEPPAPEPPAAAVVQPRPPSLPKTQPVPRRKREAPSRPRAPAQPAVSPPIVAAADAGAAQPVPAVASVAEAEAAFVPPDGRAAYRDNPQPAYPRMARQHDMQGVVIVAVLVREDGTVGEAGIRQGSGHAVLDQAAVEAVRNWRFAPATRGGQPVSARVEIPITFRLTEGDT